MTIHAKPSTAWIWRHDTPITNPPDVTAPAWFQEARFQWPAVTQGGPLLSPALIYLPWGTDVRISTSDPTLNDWIGLASVPNLVYRVNDFHLIAPDTPDREIRVLVYLEIAIAPFT